MKRPFTEENRMWVESYCSMLRQELGPRLLAHSAVFSDGRRLLDRLLSARDAVCSTGWSEWHTLDEVHNEICVALAVLTSTRQELESLQYEPLLLWTTRTIDFLVTAHNGQRYYIDVKTIGPERRDRWEQYAKAQQEGWLPSQVTVTLQKEWLGGEIWHDMMASRARMLEYTLELEEKVRTAAIDTSTDGLVMLFCSNGYHWHQDELEDFVAFYVEGKHRCDDPLANMEQHHIGQQKLELPRLVRTFAYMERQSGTTYPRKLNWHVVAPSFPF